MEAKKTKSHRKANERKASNETILEYVNELNKETSSEASTDVVKVSRALRSKDHRKHRKHRNIDGLMLESCTSSQSSTSSSRNPSHYAHKDLRIKRPSIRQKLFRQTGLYHMAAASTPTNTTRTLVQAVINTAPVQPLGSGDAVLIVAASPQEHPLEVKRKRLQRLDALQVPTMVRMGSAP